MNLYEFHGISWQERNLIKKHFGLRASMPIKTTSGNGPDIIEDDGMREGDIAKIANLTPEEALAQAKGLKTVAEIIEPKTEPKTEVKEELVKKPKAKKTTKKK